MLRFVTALSAALIVGWALAGSATTASAGGRHHGCCGPIPPSYTYSTKKIHKTITHHHDVHRTKYVKRIKPIIHVTRIQPIVRSFEVWRGSRPAGVSGTPDGAGRPRLLTPELPRIQQHPYRGVRS